MQALTKCYRALRIMRKIPRNSIHLPVKYSTIYKEKPSIPRHKSIENVEELFKFVNEGKQFYLKLLVNVLDNIEFEKLSEEQAISLLEYCGDLVADSSKEARNNVAQKIFASLSKNGQVSEHILATYIKICSENNVLIDSSKLQQNYGGLITANVLKLLLNNACNSGDIEQSFKLLELMKSHNVAVDEQVFNDLIVAHTFKGGLPAGEQVLKTMQLAQLSESIYTKLSFVKGTINRGDLNEFKFVLQKYKFKFREQEILELLACLGVNGKHSWLPEVIPMFETQTFSRQFYNKLNRLCVHLIHMNQPESSMNFYRTFVAKNDKYAYFLLKEMLHCDLPIELIANLAKQLQDDGLNEFALESITELAMKHRYVEQAWFLLENLKELRPHYFWPLLVDSFEKNGEKGLQETVNRMVKMGVKIDYDTFSNYIFNYLSSDEPQIILNKFVQLDFTVTELLSPLIINLLQNNRLVEARKLSEQHQVPLIGPNFISILSKVWFDTSNIDSLVYLLQRFCESNKTSSDFVGEFLNKSLRFCNKVGDYKNFLELVTKVKEKNLRIDASSHEYMLSVSSQIREKKLREQIEEVLDDLFDITRTSESFIPHPKNMSLEELECHLIELEEKNLETRGLLRRLTQLHSSKGNTSRVKELQDKFSELGHQDSPGLKAAIMKTQIQSNQADLALKTYEELKTLFPNFKIDSFKIVDLASCLIQCQQFQTAKRILTEDCKNIESRGLEKNFRKLLESCEDQDHQFELFNLLVNVLKICKPANPILGPLVRIHLKKNNLEEAVKTFENLSQKYNCTPLQLELFLAIAKTNNSDFLQRVFNATEKVHGKMAAQVGLAAAFAELSLNKPLLNLLTSTKDSLRNHLNSRCDRWVKEGKSTPLENLSCLPSNRISSEVMDFNIVNLCLIQCYRLNNDYEGAKRLYNRLKETERPISKKMENDLLSLMKKCK